MHLKLACADFTFPLLPHDAALDLIAAMGFDGVDVGLFEGRSHLQPSTEFRGAERAGKRLGKRLGDRGLKAADIYLQTAADFVSLAPNHPEAPRRRKARDLFRRTLDYAQACGTRHVSALPGVRFREEPAAASFARAADELAWRCAAAAAAGLVFSVEAHLGSIVPNPQQTLRLVQRVAGLTLTLDYTHFTRMGIADSQVEPLIQYASHFHARGARKGRLQTSLAENTIDYRRIVKRMQATGYRGFLGIEYVWTEWEHCNQVDNLSETILWRDFFQELSENGS